MINATINKIYRLHHSCRESLFTNEKSQKLMNISLIAIQLIGIALLAASLPGSTQLVAMDIKLFYGLAFGGSALLLGGSYFWAKLGFHHKHPAVKKTIYAITALALLTIAFGVMAYNGVFSRIGISSARCILASGYILGMPLIFPYFFSSIRCCQSLFTHKKKKIPPQIESVEKL